MSGFVDVKVMACVFLCLHFKKWHNYSDQLAEARGTRQLW